MNVKRREFKSRKRQLCYTMQKNCKNILSAPWRCQELFSSKSTRQNSNTSFDQTTTGYAFFGGADGTRTSSLSHATSFSNNNNNNNNNEIIQNSLITQGKLTKITSAGKDGELKKQGPPQHIEKKFHSQSLKGNDIEQTICKSDAEIFKRCDEDKDKDWNVSFSSHFYTSVKETSFSKQNTSREPISENPIGAEVSANQVFMENGSVKLPVGAFQSVSTRKPRIKMVSSNTMKTPMSKMVNSTSTSTSSKLLHSDAGGHVLAVTEGRGQARGEVGIAAMDPKRPLLVLCQISDGQRYMNSLAKMNVFEFTEVVVPNTFVDCGTPSILYRDIRSRFPNAVLTSVQRRHFNEGTGIDLIKQYCSPESASAMIFIRDKFYALSAAGALIRYLEFTQNMQLAPQSLKIEYQGTDDIMFMDVDTANRLELVMCSSHPHTNFRNNLLGVVNHCHTKGGVRLLRANILQPFFDVGKIQRRLDCVTELMNNSILFCSLESAVTRFADSENLLNLCMHTPQQDGLRVAEYQLRYTLLLKTTLEQLPDVMASLENAKTDYFHGVVQDLKDPRYGKILDRILETVLENAKTTKGSMAGHLHGCFAVKTGVNSLLDVAKKTYCEIVQEITDHVTRLRQSHHLPLRIAFSTHKGFHIRCAISSVQKLIRQNSLPEQFILVQKCKKTLTFYTPELVALDQRSQHVLNEIKLMTNSILFELLTDIRQNIGCLFNLCEIIAELDVLIAFAHVSSARNYVRPKFREELNLIESRHPILDVTHVGRLVPNDVRASSEKSFVVLTGPNQSGKSIYIRQVALLQVMAQIGCYVPAKEATFKLMNRIFSRIGFDDSIESNASTLVVEMRDVEYIMKNMTSRSLVIIDELCRGTSVEEGTNLAFAICEELLDTRAFIFLTTHFMLLTRLEEMYCCVTNCHFEVKFEVSEEGRAETCFTHSLKQGVTEADSYGLQVAELTSFPKNVLSKAKEISRKLRSNRKPSPVVNGLIARYELSKRLRRELVTFRPSIDREKIKPVIKRFEEEYSNLLAELPSPREGNSKRENSEICEAKLNNLIQIEDLSGFPMGMITPENVPSLKSKAEPMEECERFERKECSSAYAATLRIKHKYKKLDLLRRNRRKHVKCPV